MTFKVICRKSTIYKNYTSPLYLLFFQGKRKKYIGLGVSVAPAHWDAEAQKVTDDCPDRDNIQFQITAKIKEYEKRIQRLEIMEIPVTFENLFGQNGKRINCTVGDYLKQIIERLEALGKYASASKHRVLCSHLAQFRSLNIRFDEIDLTFLRDFELFLRKNGNASNSIATNSPSSRPPTTRLLPMVYLSKRSIRLSSTRSAVYGLGQESVPSRKEIFRN